MILDAGRICSEIDADIANFVHNIILIIKIAVPIVLVLFGMIDLGKGVVASKDDEIKKGQRTFIKRLIAGAVVFFMISIVQLVITLIDKESNGDFWTCANTLMNGKTPESTTKTNYREEEIKTNNPSAFKSCCESKGGFVKGNDCLDSNDNRIPSEEITSCVNNQQQKINEKYNSETKECCESIGGSYSNNKCIDHNGGTISETTVNSCVLNKIITNDKDLYKTCCESIGGNATNNSCVDNNGGIVSDETIKSCIFKKIN